MDNLTLKFKEAVEYVIRNKKAPSKGEIGEVLGYNTQGAFSDVLNGRVKLPAVVLQKFCELYGINSDWILFGNGIIEKEASEQRKPFMSANDVRDIVNLVLSEVSKKYAMA